MQTKQRIHNLLFGCHDICNTSIIGDKSRFYPSIRKQLNCEALFNNKAIDESRAVGMAPNISDNMIKFFSYDGKVDIQAFFRDDVAVLLNDHYFGFNASVSSWDVEMIEDWRLQCAAGKLRGNYGVAETTFVYEGLSRMRGIKDGHVLVVGSENPWLEACLLAVGARQVTTVEYRHITNYHPRIKTITPHNFRDMLSTAKEPLFDAAATFSSIEHSGLGRYGDALNPWGDLQAMARLWCAVKSGGQLLVGVMTAHDGIDRIEYNAHRVYGSLMFSHLFANWEQVWRAQGGFQIVHILEKPHLAEARVLDTSHFHGQGNTPLVASAFRRSFQSMVEDYDINFGSILHAGAHECEEMEDYEFYVPHNRILWIEALPDKVADCRQRYPHTTVINAVISDGEFDVVFHRANNGMSSSVAQLGPAHLTEYPDIKYVGDFSVRTRSLANIIDEEISTKGVNNVCDFLALDLQGYELKALVGMGHYLTLVQYIYTEISRGEMYKSMPSIDTIDAFLHHHGFTRVFTNWARTTWGNALYIRKEKT